MNTENIEEAAFEEVPKNNTEEVMIQNLGFIQATDDEDESETSMDDIKKLTGMSDQYRKTDVEQENVFVDPSTGEIIDRASLPPLEQIRIAAKNLNQTINEPHKNCKKCYGRGYTGINLDGNVPVPCTCIYEEFYKNNPDAKKPENSLVSNRQTQRRHDKQFKKYLNIQMTTLKKINDTVEKSKANLRKNTPKISPEVYTEVSDV